MTKALTGERWPALQASTPPLLETTHIVLFREFESRADQGFNSRPILVPPSPSALLLYDYSRGHIAPIDV